MTATPRLHNLARLRLSLALTQSDLAEIVGCSLPTIKAVETGKLALSKHLAMRIAEELRFLDPDWLLKNDPESPLPTVFERSFPPKYHYTGVLMDLFSRLCAVLRTIEKSGDRLSVELSLKKELTALEGPPDPNARPLRIVHPDNIKFLLKHPEEVPAGLKCIDLQELLKMSEQDLPEYPREPTSLMSAPPDGEAPSLKRLKSRSRVRK